MRSSIVFGKQIKEFLALFVLKNVNHYLVYLVLYRSSHIFFIAPIIYLSFSILFAFFFFQKKKLLPLVKAMYKGKFTTHILTSHLAWQRKILCVGRQQRNNSQTPHRSKRIGIPERILYKTEFSKDVLHSLLMAAPI